MTTLPEDEEKESHFMAGKSRVNSMDYKGAIESFEKALEANPPSASAHFELGLLYEQRENDHATAIYHYQKHLKLRPKSHMAETVRLRIESCKVELAKTVALSLVNQQIHAQLNKLTMENTALRQQIEQLKAQPAQPAPPPTNRPPVVGVISPNNVGLPPTTPPASRPQPLMAASTPSARPSVAGTYQTYVVRPGDNLKRIAERHGVALSAVLAANPGVEPRRLRVGQAIRIPVPNR